LSPIIARLKIFPINEDLEYFMLTEKVTHRRQSLISQDINLVPSNAKCRRTIVLSDLIFCLFWKLFSLSFGLWGIKVLGPDVRLIEEIIVSEKRGCLYIKAQFFPILLCRWNFH